MRKYFDFVQSGTSGRAVSGASVTVTTYPGGATASLFTDAAGTIPASNPLTTDKTGYYEFYTADGAYNLQFSGAGMTTETITNIQIYDITDVPLIASLAAPSGSSNVGDGATTVADRLSAINLASYTALRAYAGANQSAYITGYLVSANPSGTAGLFTRDDNDTTSADNGGTIIVASNGKRWKRVFSGRANVKWFGALGDDTANDSTAFSNAASAHKKLYVPAGTFRVNVGGLPNDTLLAGDGETSIIKPYDVTARYAVECDGGSSTAYITGLSFRNLQFLGTVSADGLLQTAELLNLNGVKRARIEDCYFVGFRGDGIYLGSGVSGGTERHNLDVVIKNCVFDGVTGHNRNGISVIDVDGLVIEGCTFRNCSDPTMPGCIDLEPDHSYSVIKNVKITDCKFDTCTGNRGNISISLGNSANLQNIYIAGNSFNGNVGVRIDTTSVSEPTVAHAIVVTGNTFIDCIYPWQHQFGSLWGVSIRGNVSYASAASSGAITFGSGNSSRTHKDIDVSGNQFTCTATVGMVAYDNLDGFTIAGNTFRGASQAHIRIGATGNGTSSSNVAIIENKMLGSPAQGAILHQSDTPNALTNVLARNFITAGVTHGFKATMTDSSGSTTNTYTETTLPNAFPYGEHLCTLSAGSIPGVGTGTGDAYGVLYTHANSSQGSTYTWQEFKPATTGDLAKRLFRRATATTTWDSWKTLTGT